MTYVRLTRFLLALFLPLALSACSGPTYEWKQKYTVTVETPRGIRTGSSVLAISWHDFSTLERFGSSNAGRHTLSGEVPFVDLGGGRYLFALVIAKADQLVYGLPDTRDAYKSMRRNNSIDFDAFQERLPELIKARAQLPIPTKYAPLLVTFGNIADPASVTKVDPDHLDATFGPGYRLKSIKVELTDEPETKGQVERALIWMKAISGRILKPSDKKYEKDLTDEEKLVGTDFVRNVQ